MCGCKNKNLTPQSVRKTNVYQASASNQVKLDAVEELRKRINAKAKSTSIATTPSPVTNKEFIDKVQKALSKNLQGS
jgi:hypothetical protein